MVQLMVTFVKLGLHFTFLDFLKQLLKHQKRYQNVSLLWSKEVKFLILDEMRKKSREDGLQTTGEGLEWGVLFGFGPGLTVETVVLHSVAA